MNILYLNTTYQCGGAEKVTSQLFHGMQSRGHQVFQIVSYDTRNSSLPPHVHVLYPTLPMRIFNRLITGNHSNTSLRILYSRSRILHFIKKHQIDLVHLHNPHDNFLGILDIAEIAARCPVLWTLHDFWAMTGHCTYPHGCDDRWKNGCLECLCLNNYPAIRKDCAHHLLIQKSKAYQNAGITFTVPSKWMEEQFRQSHLSGQPCYSVYNGLDTSIWQPLPKDALRRKYELDSSKKILAFIAADPGKKLKGMNHLLEALSLIPDPQNYLLLVAGRENPEVTGLETRFPVRSFGYLSSQEKLNEFYALADVLVNPSVYETFGLTNIEAMASGTPVIAFSVCTIPEIIDENCGWIVPDINASSLKNCIQEALVNPELSAHKGRASRKKAETLFSETTMLDQFEKLYRQLLSNK